MAHPPALLVGSVTHGCYKRSAFHAVHAGQGTFKLAPADPRLPNLLHGGHQRMWEQRSTSPSTTRHTSTRQALAASGSTATAGHTAAVVGSIAASTVADDGGQLSWRVLADLLLSTPGLNTELLPSQASFLHNAHVKLAVNCALNPVTALLACRNGHVASDAAARETVEQCCAELFSLMREPLLGLPSAAALSSVVLGVAEATAENRYGTSAW